MSDINLTLIRKNPLSIPAIIAAKKGIFNKYNVKVNLTLPYDFNFGGKNPFLEGESDAMMGDVTFFFYMLEKGKKAVITSNLTRTISLIGKKNLPKNLDNIKVGVNRSGMFMLFLENDLKDIIKNPEIVWINNTYERIEALKSGKIDALVAIEPFVSEILEDGGEIIWNLRDSDKNLVMWCFEEEFFNNNEERVKNFHKALEEAKIFFNNLDPKDKVNIGVEYAGYDLKEARKLERFTFEKGEKFRKEDFTLCQEWMYKTKEILNKYNADKMIVDILNEDLIK